MSSDPQPETQAPEVAPFGRRVVGLLVDWIACLLIFNVVISPYIDVTPLWRSFGPLLVLFAEHLLLVATAGFTLGHRVAGLRVTAVSRPWLTPLQSFIRAALLCLFIPPLVVGKAGRGLHDVAAGTRIVRI